MKRLTDIKWSYSIFCGMFMFIALVFSGNRSAVAQEDPVPEIKETAKILGVCVFNGSQCIIHKPRKKKIT